MVEGGGSDRKGPIIGKTLDVKVNTVEIDGTDTRLGMAEDGFDSPCLLRAAG